MLRKTGRPGYLQIADDLREQMRAGTLGPGDALPSTAELGERYDVSAGVVKAAISVLRTEGLVVGQQGKGVFVRDQAETAEQAPAGDDALTKHLAEILASVRDLGERVARLEQSVFPGQPPEDRPGK